MGAARDTCAAGRSATPGGPRAANRVNRLRNRLVLIPLAATVWVTTSLLEESIDTSSTSKLDTLSKSLNRTAREFYNRACDDLKRQAQSGELAPIKYTFADRA